MDEYPYPLYPPYCQGAFYLLHLTVAEELYLLFEEEFHRNYLWIEDVFLTGIFILLNGKLILINIVKKKLSNKWYFVNKIVLTYCEKKLL